MDNIIVLIVFFLGVINFWFVECLVEQESTTVSMRASCLSVSLFTAGIATEGIGLRRPTHCLLILDDWFGCRRCSFNVFF